MTNLTTAADIAHAALEYRRKAHDARRTARTYPVLYSMVEGASARDWEDYADECAATAMEMIGLARGIRDGEFS